MNKDDNMTDIDDDDDEEEDFVVEDDFSDIDLDDPIDFDSGDFPYERD